jgi:dTDP-4-dehydrorhamnose 3,5-epimerase
MKIEETKLPGVYLIRREASADARGSFARVLCRKELEAAGLCGEIAQVNLSINTKKATLRGLHSQQGEDAEDKIVTCTAGVVFDVCVDVQETSPNFGEWYATVLSPENGLALYVPKGFAHGYLTLTDDAQVLYFVSQFYKPGAEQGYRWDDPAFGINWPLPAPYVISEKDASWPFIAGGWLS